jgi:starch phosphorylase
MKFAMNGALTIGTLDGANVELREEIGAENFFCFGLKAHEALELKSHGYRPRDYYESDEEIAAVIDMIADGFFSRGDKELFKPVVNKLLEHDPYLVLADFPAYAQCQRQVDRAYKARESWTRLSILNAARTGKFSSDRAMHEYCRDIWRVGAMPITLPR